MAKTVYSRESEALAKILAKARKDAGLHQADLAARLGRDQAIVSNIERGQRRVDVIEFYTIAKAIRRDPIGLYREVVTEWEKGES
ncbi:MAG TPA: helix-turn-helix transcriptional regulator [Allosphingosinicella sp.]|jgi:transcriptional regulator with XRE-family HTH domain